MKNKYLEMKYHPAKKQVEFLRVDHDGQEAKKTPIKTESALHKYVREKGKFILQDKGNEFFDAISRAYDGESQISTKVIMTKLDFEDWKNMVDFYNQTQNNCEITTTLLAELPSMEESFQMVKNHGEMAKKVLVDYKDRFSPHNAKDESVKTWCQNFQYILSQRMEEIHEKINALQSNEVNLCFAGVYSAGKSSLINGILGARVLPESVESKTAKMFQISSPPKGEPISITFDMEGNCTKITWDEDSAQLQISQGEYEIEDRAKLQKTIEDVKEKNLPCHTQIMETLDCLNELESVGDKLRFHFPIPLDTDSLQFTIYDTPGTDSNEDAHKHTLIDALEAQTHSILIYIVRPGKLEGSGNKYLLQYLANAEANNHKTSIDIHRSLFVVNHSDTLDEEDRTSFHNQTITCKEKDEHGEEQILTEISLADKKLFFLSAKYGYIGKAIDKYMASPSEEKDFRKKINHFTDFDDERYFQQNRFGTSEIATSIMTNQSKLLLDQAIQEEHQGKIMEISSGITALESSITEYGTKYAIAVKTFAIIDTVEQVLKTMVATATSLSSDSKTSIQNLDKDIETLKNTLVEEVEKTSATYALKEKKLDRKTIEELGLTPGQLKVNFEDAVIRSINTRFKKFLGFTFTSSKDKETLKNVINSEVTKFTRDYEKKARICLSKVRINIQKDLKQAIATHSDLSNEAKAYFVELTIPQPQFSCDTKDFEKLVDICSGDFFLKMEKLKSNVREQLLGTSTHLSDELSHHYSNSLKEFVDYVSRDFMEQIKIFSVQITAMEHSKDEMNVFQGHIDEVITELQTLTDSLAQEIWRELDHD